MTLRSLVATPVRRGLLALALAAGGAALADRAAAFCGFYVAQADAKLFNNASRVVLARQGNRTTLTMANDYSGEPKEFAIVIPVPTVVKKEQIRISENALVDQLDGYTAPRLAEYYDEDPCNPYPDYEELMSVADDAGSAAPRSAAIRKEVDYKVKIEAQYDVGEYDILILSAEDSSGLERWLVDNGYKIPSGAGPILGSYIKQNMKFFVAKVDLKELNKVGGTGAGQFLRPLQVEYESPKFMLPIRLGMVNADGAQDLVVYALTERGRVETTNYRTTKIPTDLDVPEYVAQEFGPFYKALFARQVAKQGMETVFLEYAWPLSISCDPCTGIYLSGDALNKLGAGWASEYHGGVNGGFITRLHVRYDLAHFPEDLVFQETADASTFQGRYVIHHPFTGDTSCDAGVAYKKELRTRYEREIQNTVTLTGWSADDVRKKIPGAQKASTPSAPSTWWGQQ